MTIQETVLDDEEDSQKGPEKETGVNNAASALDGRSGAGKGSDATP